MEHISIIHSVQPNKCRIPYETMEDLKLTGILPERVLRVMQSVPSREDILIRQEIFRYLWDNGACELKELLYSLVELKKLFSAYSEAEGVKSRQYIFAALLYRICRFYRDCSELKIRAGFFDGFIKHFSELYDEALLRETEQLYNNLVRDICISVKEDKLVVSSKTTEGYVSAIYRCAGEMDIALDKKGFEPKGIGAELADTVAAIYPELWSSLEALHGKYKELCDEGILGYIDQLDFYISNIELAQKYKGHSIPVSYAHITDDGSVSITQGHDITLMAKECYDIIPNDITFDSHESIFFLAGANGGGKTTYLRTAGVNVILALCGCPVPCTHARVCILDSVLTHFPKDERFELDGRFIDEQKRVDAILSDMGKRSLILLNETYATTNEQKATEMTCELALKLREAGQFCIYVTHQKGVYELDIPMLCCVVDEEDSNRRTYKIRRVRETVTSHAEDVLRKYSLSRADLEERFGI